MEKYYYETSSHSYYQKSFYIYVFKFATISAAVNCHTNFDFGTNFKSNIYGNLVVVVDTDISDHVFGIIDRI